MGRCFRFAIVPQEKKGCDFTMFPDGHTRQQFFALTSSRSFVLDWTQSIASLKF
jgi:hypothetical protein